MEYKAPFVWVLLGVIFGSFISVIRISMVLMFKSIDQGFFSGFFGSFGINFGNVMNWMLMYSIIGLVLSIVLIFYVVKIARTPTKTDFIVTTILGFIGIFLGINEIRFTFPHQVRCIIPPSRDITSALFLSKR